MRFSEILKNLGNPIAYYPSLAKPLGGAAASILFGQLFYWWDKCDQEKGIYKTAEELELETGLTIQEQRSARTKLKKLGILSEIHKRLEHRLYFTLNLEIFDAYMASINFNIPEVANQQPPNEDSTSPKCEINIPELQNQHSGSEDSTFVELENQHSYIRALDYQETTTETTALYLVDQSKIDEANSVDSDESTPDPEVNNLKTEKRFSSLAKIFNRTFADCEPVKKISMQAKATNKKRMALVPPAWSFGQKRVLALVDQGLIAEATGAEVLRWFERYFAECLKDPFINGSQARGKGHEAWKASFEYLMRITELEKRVLEEG